MKLEVPENIGRWIEGRGYSSDGVGMSGSQVLQFDEMVLKIEEQQEESDNEYRMMDWLEGRLPVPRILCHERKKGVNYLLMSRIEGRMSCSPEYLENPGVLIKALADGLRMLWSVGISDCPHNNAIENKLRLAGIRVREKLCDVEHVEPGTYGENGFDSPAHLLGWLRKNRPEEELVFSHGDYCLPNIFLSGDSVSGFIDLGRSGIADKYQDIALCYRSLRHNFDGFYGGKVYGGFRPEALFDELGIAPDWDKIRYYILMDELF